MAKPSTPSKNSLKKLVRSTFFSDTQRFASHSGPERIGGAVGIHTALSRLFVGTPGADLDSQRSVCGSSLSRARDRPVLDASRGGRRPGPRRLCRHAGHPNAQRPGQASVQDLGYVRDGEFDHLRTEPGFIRASLAMDRSVGPPQFSIDFIKAADHDILPSRLGWASLSF